MIMNSNMVKPEKVGHLYLVYHFTVPLTPLYTFCCCFLSSVLTMILWLFYHLPGKNEQQFFIIFEAPAHIIFSSHRWYYSTFRALSFDLYFVYHLHLSSWKTKFVKFVLFYPGGLLLFFFLKERMMILELVDLGGCGFREVLGYLSKLKRVVELAFGAHFLYNFFI